MLSLFLLAACPKPAPLPASGAPEEASVGAVDPAVAGVDSPLLRSLLAEHWDGTMARHPGWASALGDRRFEERLFDPSDGAVQAWVRRQQEWSLRASAFPDNALSPRDRVTRDLLLEELRSALALQRCRFHQWSVSARSNALVGANALAEDARLKTPADADALLSRYRALPASIRTQIDNLRAGLAAGRVGNRESLQRVIDMLDEELASDAVDSALFAVVDSAPEEWDGAGAWRAALLETLTGEVRPAFAEYRAVLHDELLPASRIGEAVGLHALPNGSECYDALIRDNTTRDIAADQLHATGLAELERIHAEFRILGESVLGTSDLAEIFARLRTQPDLYFDSAASVQATAQAALSRAEAAAPEWFGVLPKAPCTVDAVPDYLAPYTTIAYYQPARPDGSRPGIYYVNTLAPETRPRHEAEVLAFHESIPGHHLQIVIGQEVGELPSFRRHGGFTVFVEGWALYTERLADEMGLYTGDLDRLGMLSFDAWRASRLVVDTGIHAQGWTREQAVAFLTENTPLAVNNIDNEVDRYITTPGQALAYKTGQLEILALRAEAQEALGDAFDIRAFHDVVLGGGAVTLPVLSEAVHRWVERNADAP